MKKNMPSGPSSQSPVNIGRLCIDGHQRLSFPSCRQFIGGNHMLNMRGIVTWQVSKVDAIFVENISFYRIPNSKHQILVYQALECSKPNGFLCHSFESTLMGLILLRTCSQLHPN